MISAWKVPLTRRIRFPHSIFFTQLFYPASCRPAGAENER